LVEEFVEFRHALIKCAFRDYFRVQHFK
jgi:hypothetical protein